MNLDRAGKPSMPSSIIGKLSSTTKNARVLPNSFIKACSLVLNLECPIENFRSFAILGRNTLEYVNSCSAVNEEYMSLSDRKSTVGSLPVVALIRKSGLLVSLFLPCVSRDCGLLVVSEIGWVFENLCID